MTKGGYPTPDWRFFEMTDLNSRIPETIDRPNNQWHDVVRRADKTVVGSFPANGRYLIYHENGVVSMRPLLEDERVFTIDGFMQFTARLGYRHIPPSDIMISTD